MRDPDTGSEARQLYGEVVQCAARHALRYLPWDQARELAHDVASELVRGRAAGRDIPDEPRALAALIARAIAFRVRDVRRAQRRRAAAEGVHHEERASMTPAWAEPGATLEARELAKVVNDTVADMPHTMRQVFLLVRREACSYKEVAARLGIGVGTVHTHFSRATARLRESTNRYRDGDKAPAARHPTALPARKR